MNRTKLILSLRNRISLLSAANAAQSVRIIQEAIVNELCQGGRVEIRGFGSFGVYSRPPRIARNPKTGDQVLVPEKHLPYFKPGTALRKRINVEEINSTQNGWILFRALMVVEAFTIARNIGEPYDTAIESAVKAVHTLDPDMEASPSLVKEILKQYKLDDH